MALHRSFYTTFYVLVGLIATIFIFSFLFETQTPEERVTEHEYQVAEIRLSDALIYADVADTDEKRITGLSYRESLDRDKGMLFVFDEIGKHGIWMKEMNFPIDILWIGDDNRIVSIVENASPESYFSSPPTVFRPAENSRFVLELNSGFVAERSVKVGDSVGISM
jgi:uncharacterized protein